MFIKSLDPELDPDLDFDPQLEKNAGSGYGYILNQLIIQDRTNNNGSGPKSQNERIRNNTGFKGTVMSSVMEPKIFLLAPAPRSRNSAPAPAPAPALDSFIRYLENYLF